MNNKTIIITGKNNVENIKRIKKNKRIRTKSYNIEYNYEREILLINNIFNNIDDSLNEIIIKEIKRKINGYKVQDIKKNIYDNDKLININDVIHKFYDCKLKCYYCDEKVQLFYKIVREPKQWTLDRIDNDLCHSNKNTIICCLSCNIKRRLTDKDKFEFTKKLTIIKK
jgi:hypothetical protein